MQPQVGTIVKAFHEVFGIGFIEEKGSIIYTRIYFHSSCWRAASMEEGCRNQRGLICYLDRKPSIDDVIKITEVNHQTVRGVVVSPNGTPKKRTEKKFPSNHPAKNKYARRKKQG